MKNRSERKAAVKLTIFGCIFAFLCVLLTGFIGISNRSQGFRNAMADYWNIWMPSKIHSPLSYFCLVLLLFDICLLIALIVMSIAKKKGHLVVAAFGLFLAVAFIPFLLLFIVPQAEQGNMGRLALYTLSGASIMLAFAIVLFFIALKPLFNAGVGVITSMGGKVDEEAAAGNGLTEGEVRAIVSEYLQAHKEELHKGGAVVAAEEETKEEAVEEVKEEEPVEEAEEAEEAEEEAEVDEDGDEVEEVEEVQADGTVLKIKRKKRVPFETRLKKSVFDLRHKYYDLRDYIKWYGIKNRISIPGDTFSLKRKKYAFITIVGKHIKLYAAIDPAKYEDSPIPVEKATAKRYEETPCVLRVKSDLSYRRAKMIIDDVMAAAGIEKPEGPEPKETQHPEAD